MTSVERLRAWIEDYNSVMPKDFARSLLAESEQAQRLRKACKKALYHVRELREAWMTGALSEHDGKGGLRSNRNVDVESQLSAALRASAPEPPAEQEQTK